MGGQIIPEKLRRLINLWNSSLSAAPTNLFGMEAPFIYLEVGRVAVERLKEEGVDLIRDSPLETINAVYSFFVDHGYFEEAWARPVTLSPDQGEGDIYELYERGAITFESNWWAFYSGECRSPACFCYNIFRYALSSGFGLDFNLIDSEVKRDTMEDFIKVSLVQISEENLRSMDIIEELRKREGALKRILGAYKKVINMSVDAIITINDSGMITIFNPAAERMFGFNQKDAMGRNVTDLMPEEYREKHLEGLNRFMETEKPVIVGKTVEVEGLREDGSRFPLEISLAAEKVEGKWVFTAGLRDITDRKRLEDQLRDRLDEVERFNRLMVGRELKMAEMRKEINRLRSNIRELDDNARVR